MEQDYLSNTHNIIANHKHISCRVSGWYPQNDKYLWAALKTLYVCCNPIVQWSSHLTQLCGQIINCSSFGRTTHARSTLCTLSTCEEHWRQCRYCAAQATQHTVCPQGQKVAPTGFSLQTRQVMRFLILDSSSSSCRVLLNTAEASK